MKRPADSRVVGAIAMPVLSLITWLIMATPSQAACEFFSEPQRYNTQTDGDVVVIGAQLNRPYRVVVAGKSAAEDEAMFAGIRACVLDAFITCSELGTYIQVGSFNRRSDAETIQRILRRAGYRARTIYGQ